jgi:RimJ/RimL family protein N-acetyltransferase
MPEIETLRLQLRHCTFADADDLARIRGDAEVMRFIGDRKPQSKEKVGELLREIIVHWQKHNFGRWAVINKADNQFIGICGFNYLNHTEEIEIGYLLAKSAWGKGLATEAAKACLRYGFEELQLEQIVAVAFPENIASRKVMEKLNMRYIKLEHLNEGLVAYYEIWRKEFKPDDSLYILKGH